MLESHWLKNGTSERDPQREATITLLSTEMDWPQGQPQIRIKIKRSIFKYYTPVPEKENLQFYSNSEHESHVLKYLPNDPMILWQATCTEFCQHSYGNLFWNLHVQHKKMFILLHSFLNKQVNWLITANHLGYISSTFCFDEMLKYKKDTKIIDWILLFGFLGGIWIRHLLPLHFLLVFTLRYSALKMAC